MSHYVVTTDDAMRVYQAAMRVPDAKPYLRELGDLQSALARPYATFGSLDLYPTLHEKAAALLHGVAKAHGFADGNKRTAVLITLVMVRMSGYDLPKALRNKLDDIVVNVVTEVMTQGELAAWFQVKLRPRRP